MIVHLAFFLHLCYLPVTKGNWTRGFGFAVGVFLWSTGGNIIYKSNYFWSVYSLLFSEINCNYKQPLLYIKWAHLIIFLLSWQELHLSLTWNFESLIWSTKILLKCLPFIIMTFTFAPGKLEFRVTVLSLQVICLTFFFWMDKIIFLIQFFKIQFLNFILEGSCFMILC